MNVRTPIFVGILNTVLLSSMSSSPLEGAEPLPVTATAAAEVALRAVSPVTSDHTSDHTPDDTSDHTPDDAEALARAQVERGYQLLINGGYIGCGIPLDAIKRTQASTPPVPSKLLSILFPLAGEQVFKENDLPGRNADNIGISPTFNVFESPRGLKVVNSNCLSCHGEYLDGKFIVGLGNRTRDYTQDVSNVARRFPQMAKTELEREELNILSRATVSIAPYMQTKTIGVNPAVNMTYALFSFRRAEDYAWSDTLTMEPPGKEFPPSDVPPWWHLKEKGLMFYNGEFGFHHHRVMTLASILCIKGADEMRERDEPFRDLEQYVLSLESPSYPLPIDAGLAERGRDVYEETCARCHGELNEAGKPEYEAKIIEIDKIKTDPALMEQQSGPEHERFRAFGEETFVRLYGEGLKVSLNRGYIVPPLSGVWATAPYLHNASVPTLEAVINSKIRPKYWQKLGIYEQNDYDLVHMGVRHRVRSTGQELAGPFTKRFIYDTTLPGYGNGGHTFGDDLSDTQRQALLEFLKTL
ncbi:MAG: hypothetical protein ACKO6N_04835 [Myxococcota bacterium]